MIVNILPGKIFLGRADFYAKKTLNYGHNPKVLISFFKIMLLIL